MDFEKNLFWKKWAKSINKSKTIIYDELKEDTDEIIIPFRNKKNTIDDRKLCRNIYNWCIDNNIEVHQIEVISSYDDKEYNGLQIKFNF